MKMLGLVKEEGVEETGEVRERAISTVSLGPEEGKEIFQKGTLLLVLDALSRSHYLYNSC